MVTIWSLRILLAYMAIGVLCGMQYLVGCSESGGAVLVVVLREMLWWTSTQGAMFR